MHPSPPGAGPASTLTGSGPDDGDTLARLAADVAAIRATVDQLAAAVSALAPLIDQAAPVLARLAGPIAGPLLAAAIRRR